MPNNNNRSLSDLAIEKLHSSGISEDDALAAGLYSVDDSEAEVHEEFAAVPGLVIPYFDTSGQPVYFERDGEFLQFIRIRYLENPPPKPRAGGFAAPSRKPPPKYIQYKESGTRAYFPRVSELDWSAIAADHNTPVAIVEGEFKAIKLCIEGLTAIGIGGVDSFLHKVE